MVGSCDVLGPATGCPACPAHGFRSDSDFTAQLAYFSAQRYGSPNEAIPVLWAGERWVEMLRGEAIDGSRERRSGPDMMRWLRIESVKALVVVLCLSCAAALLGACADTKGGKRYLQDLDALIARTDRIEVVEHSSPFDIAHAVIGELRKAKERVYKRVVLTPSQRPAFSPL